MGRVTGKFSMKSLRRRPPAFIRGNWIIASFLCLTGGVISVFVPSASEFPVYWMFIAMGLCLAIAYFTPRVLLFPVSILLWFGAYLLIGRYSENENLPFAIEAAVAMSILFFSFFAVIMHLDNRTKKKKKADYRHTEIIHEVGHKFELQPGVRRLQGELGLPYYFILTFSTETEADLFWTHLSGLHSPPVPLLALSGTWRSVDYGNVRRWFVGWLCRDQRDSNAISHWEVSFRKPETPAGASYGSPSSPLSVGFQLENLSETRDWTKIER
jgi:hypothetical protein